MTITSAAALASSTGTATSSLSVTATAVNDVWVVWIVVKSSVTVTGVSGGNATGWTNVTGNWSDGNSFNESIWIGEMTSTGSTTISFTYSGSVAGVGIDIDAHPFHSSVGSPAWTADGSGGHLVNSPATTVNFPTLAPTSGTELYWGHGRVAGTANTPLPSGFVANNDANGNPEMYNVAVSASVSPTLAQTSNSSNTIAILLSEVALSVAKSSSDTATGTDAGAVPSSHLSSADVETAVEAGHANATLSSADLETAVEAGHANATLSSSDAGSGADAGSVTVPISSSDTATGTDAGAVPSSHLSSADVETAVEAGHANATLSSSDLETAVEAGAPVIPFIPSQLRTFHVPPESRTWTVVEPSRKFTVPPESRTFTVEA